MSKLNQHSINDVLNTEPEIQAQVLHKYLAEGIPHQTIESSIPELTEHLGWNSWQIVKFYGFGKSDKGQFKDFSYEQIKAQLEKLDMKKISEFHLETLLNEEDDKKDLFTGIKMKVAKLKIRKEFKNVNQLV